MAQEVLRVRVHKDGAPPPAAREDWLNWILAHDRALRVLLGARRAEPVEAVRASWLALMHALLRRLPAADTAARPLDGLVLHLDALRAAGVPSSDIVAAVNSWRMERVR